MRFYYIAVILTGIMLLLNIGGFETPTGSLVKAFNFVDSNGNLTIQNFKNSGLWKNSSATDSTPGLNYLLIGAIAAGIVLGAFGRSPDIRYITAGMVFILTSLLASDLIFLFVKIQSFGVYWITGIGSILVGCSLVGLFITALEFWQGTD